MGGGCCFRGSLASHWRHLLRSCLPIPPCVTNPPLTRQWSLLETPSAHRYRATLKGLTEKMGGQPEDNPLGPGVTPGHRTPPGRDLGRPRAETPANRSRAVEAVDRLSLRRNGCTPRHPATAGTARWDAVLERGPAGAQEHPIDRLFPTPPWPPSTGSARITTAPASAKAEGSDNGFIIITVRQFVQRNVSHDH